MKTICTILTAGVVLVSTLAEAQLTPEPSAVQQSTSFNGPITTMAVYDGKLAIGGTFTEVDGLPCNGLVTWDGIDFEIIPNTPVFIESTSSANRIYTLHQSENSLYVGGSFQNIETGEGIENFGNMARYDGTVWHRLVSTPSTLYGATDGPVKSLQFHEGKLYVGGDFTTVDVNAGIPVGHLATYNWNSSPEWEVVGSSGLSGNAATCEVMTLWEDRVVVAGRFTAADSVDSHNVVIYDEVLGFISVNTGDFTSTIGRVRCLAIQNDRLYAGGDYSNIGQNALFGLNAYNGDEWLDLDAEIGLDRRALFACSDDYIWVGGLLEEFGADVNNLLIYDVNQDVVIPFSDEYWGVDGIVNSMVEYNGELYIAGEFEHLMGSNGEPNLDFKNIFKVSNYCSPTVDIEDIAGIKSLHIYPNPVSNTLFVHSDSGNELRNLRILDILGQPIIEITRNSPTIAIDVGQLSPGIYFVTTHDGNEKGVWKFVKH